LSGNTPVGAKCSVFRSSNETVACGNDLTRSLRGDCEYSPGVAGFEIDGKDSVGVIAFEGLQPCLEFTFVLAFLEKSNSFGDFSDGYDTDKQTVVFESFHRTADAWFVPLMAARSTGVAGFSITVSSNEAQRILI